MTIRLSAFRWVPPFVQGLVRDLRVRWALEEAQLPYEEMLLGSGEQKSEEYRGYQPFGQVPAFEEDGLVLFESGAIVMHVAERCDALLPAEPAARARAKTWMFAALNTLEPPIQNLTEIDLFHAQADWAQSRRPDVVDRVTTRLTELAHRLEGRDYLDGRFTAADLLMTTVLQNLRHTDLLAQIPPLAAYCRRCEERPAFQKAMTAQMATFARHAPARH